MHTRYGYYNFSDQPTLMETYTLLVAEDEVTLNQLICEHLRSQGNRVLSAKNGEQALSLYLSEEPDLLVLDIMMPRMDGLDLARKVQMDNSKTPIIFLTAKDQPRDVVLGFEAGAKDYIKKPFSLEELTVRIPALLQRTQDTVTTEILAIGKYRFNHIKQQLSLDDLSQTLTHRESELLFYLIQNRNQILDRSLILKKLWRDDDFFSARSMDVFISKLRKKLKADPEVQILNVRGQGYKLIC